jgi:hypothetical protein
MRRAFLLVFGLAVSAAGCMSSVAVNGRCPERPVAMLPARVPLESAGSRGYRQDSDYRFAADLSCTSASMEYIPGIGAIPSSDEMLALAGFAWYWMGAVKDAYDDTPVALWPVSQLASAIRAEAGFGDLDPGAAGGSSSILDWNVRVEYVSPRAALAGLGFSLLYGVKTIEDGGGSGTDVTDAVLSADLVYHVQKVKGLILELGYARTSTEEDPWDWAVDGLEGGIRYYRKLGMKSWIDAELKFAFLDYEPGPLLDDDAKDLYLRLAWYPTKRAGLAVTWGQRDWNGNDAWDEDRLGVQLTYMAGSAHGLDLSLGWEKSSADTWGGDNSAVTLTAGYRF